LIIGGIANGSDYPFIQSVELYNWRTKKQCQLPDFPIPICCGTAVVVGETPAYCGGGLQRRKEFGFKITTTLGHRYDDF
jgi:hypothetical protein